MVSSLWTAKSLELGSGAFALLAFRQKIGTEIEDTMAKGKIELN